MLYRVDAGGPAVAATDNGPDWMADASDTDPGAQFRDHQSNSAGYSQVANVNPVVPASTPISIFNTERWGPTDSPPLTGTSRSRPARMSTFGCTSPTATAARARSASGCSTSAVDGSPVLSNYDIVADAGDQTGTMKAFDVTIRTGDVTST